MRPNSPAIGIRNGMAKITNEDAWYIRHSNASPRALADELGVTRATISMIRLNQTWKHVRE